MMTPAAPTEDIQRLEQLTVLGMGMAQRLHDAANTTDDLDDLARIGTAFHHVSRGVRQTIALKLRLASGWVPATRAAEPTPAAAPAPTGPARERPESTSWNEYERLDCEDLLDDLDRLADTPEDEPLDLERLEKALDAGVARFQRGLLALRAKPRPTLAAVSRTPASRASLMTGAALRVVDSS